MADFSEFIVPSAEWVALEAQLPPSRDIPVDELKFTTNTLRRKNAAQAMIDEGKHMFTKSGV